MLMDLIEWEEGKDGTAQPLPLAFAKAAGPLLPALGDCTFLFAGRPPMAPGYWLAGGLLRNGLSVSGAGESLGASLGALCGEASELALFSDWRHARSADSSADAPDWYLSSAGLGAGWDLASAVTHGALELIERQVVLDWWQHGGIVRTIEPPGPTWAKALFGRTQERRCDLLLLGEPGPAVTVMAVSFKPNGFGFCFGAAARADLTTAIRSAAKELLQSEFGLELAQSKLERHGEEKLGNHDRLAIHHAASLHRSAILDEAVATIEIDDQQFATTRLDLSAAFQWRDLGRYRSCLLVAKVAKAPLEILKYAAAPTATKALTHRSTIPLY